MSRAGRGCARTLAAAALALAVGATVAWSAPAKPAARPAAKAPSKTPAQPAPPAPQPPPIHFRAPYIWVLDPSDCTPGLRHQPDGPFAALVFCEQSFGAYLAVSYLETMAAPGHSHIGRWGVSDRVWQDSTWAGDVTSFVWTPDGKSLITATSTNYGTGGLYQLDLMARTVKQLKPGDHTASPREPGPGYVLEQIDVDRGVIYYHALPWNLPAGVTPEDSLFLAPGP